MLGNNIILLPLIVAIIVIICGAFILKDELLNLIGIGTDCAHSPDTCYNAAYYVNRIRMTYPWLMMSSIVFLIIAKCFFLRKSVLPIVRGNFIMCYMVSLGFAYFSLVMIALFNQIMLAEYNAVCMTVGYTYMASILMCFFWLSSMAFDIWMLSRNPMRHNTSFYKYCLFAFGVLIFTLIVLMLDMFKVLPEGWRTNIGVYSCDVTDTPRYQSEDFIQASALTIYIQGPIMLLFIVVVGLYVGSFYALYQAKKQNSANVPRRNFFWQFSLIMTLLWAIEIPALYFDDSITFSILSMVNCSQGLIIFGMFLCCDDKPADIQPDNNNIAMSNMENGIKN